PVITGEGWDDGFKKAQAFLAELSVEEKIHLVTGASAYDGPNAIRVADYSSVFPAGISAGASWDRNLIYKRGFMMGSEFKGKGAHVALGPTAGPLGRSVLDGRYWEGFGIDPYLSGVGVSETVKGMQSAGVQACVKHYIANEQETQRNPSTNSKGQSIASISSNLDDRTLHELYLWPFADAVKAGVASVMCSYNRINGTYACENDRTINQVLKTELGFQGYVVSDWGGTMSGPRAINSGLDMTMPGGIGLGIESNTSFFGFNISTAIMNGNLDTSRVDDMVLRVMTPYFQLGQNEGFPTVDPSSASLFNFDQAQSPFIWNITGPTHRDVREDHADLIRELGAASVVLLKNLNNTLPIREAPLNIGVFGNDAADSSDGLYRGIDSPTEVFGFNIGTFYMGGGSADGRLTYLVSSLDAIKAWVPKGGLVQYMTNNEGLSTDLKRLYPRPEICLVFLKSYVSEGADRIQYDVDWDGNSVVSQVAATCPKTIVVVHAGGAVSMPWSNHPNVTAILAAHIPGQESGNAILDVITGKVNPSGHLPYTIAKNITDYNAPIVNLTNAGPDGWQSNFTEGLMIDYRHFDNADIEPLYEFGFGLSYTTFNISAIRVIHQSQNISARLNKHGFVRPGGNPDLHRPAVTLTIEVANTGLVDGSAVPQLYVAFPQDTSPVGTPQNVLRGFDKVYIPYGHSKKVTFTLTTRDVSYWDAQLQEWIIPEGEFKIRVGFSSRDLHRPIMVKLV
ncbi:beta-glucosidase G, partial [Fusarium proliferatum]